jgi:hypothetical protein
LIALHNFRVLFRQANFSCERGAAIDELFSIVALEYEVGALEHIQLESNNQRLRSRKFRGIPLRHIPSKKFGTVLFSHGDRIP